MGLYCEICKEITEFERNNIFFVAHVKKIHNLTSKEYYDKFIKKESEGKCKICFKETTFITVTRGYQKYCSKDCLFKDDEIKEQWKKTNIEKYGSSSPLGSKVLIEKGKETLKEKYGVEFISQNKEVKERSINTFKERFGIGSENHGNIQERRIETLKEKFGEDYKKELIKIRNKNNLEKYGVEHTVLLDSVKEKREKTNLEKFGAINPLLNKEIQNKIHKTNIERYGSIYPIISKERRLEINQKIYFKKINETLPEGYELIEFIPKKYYKVKCDKEHEFEIFTYNLINNRKKRNQEICPICNPQTEFRSNFEKEIVEFIKNNYQFEMITNTKSIISPFELDIFIPDLKIAFEFNGIFWHNEIYKSNIYHLNKTEMCESQGIHLIHIYEDDWNYKREIVKSRILNLLQKNHQKIFGRKCEVKDVSFSDSKKFLEENHIQGNCVSKIRFGLYYENELISLMTFGNMRVNLGRGKENGKMELLRFCNKLNFNVLGSAGRLFNWFLKNNLEIEEIVSYADRSWSYSLRNVYETLGFEFLRKTKPNYSYVVKDLRINRFSFRKDVLISEGFDGSKTEHEIMLERKIYRIYDSGSLLYRYMRKV